MIVIVSGSKGYVGRQAVKRCLDLGYEVIGFDVHDPIPVDDMVGAHLFIHTAAISSNQAPESKGELLDTNLILPQTLFSRWRYVSAVNSTFVAFSSHHVNTGLSLQTWSPYSVSKYLMESALRNMHIRMFEPRRRKLVCIRPGVIWGRETDRTPSQRSVLYRAFHGELDKFFEGSERAYIHVDDLLTYVLGLPHDSTAAPTPPHTFTVAEKDPMSSDYVLDLIPDDIPRMSEEEGLRYPTPKIETLKVAPFPETLSITKSWMDFKKVLKEESDDL